MNKLKRLIPNWERVQVHPTAEIDVRELAIGDGSIIGPGVVIEGTRVVIGREAWLDRGAYIGGGSARDPIASLECGDWLHMGRNSHINNGRPVTIGSEFGCGIETKVFAHGAYLSELDGFPVRFEGCRIGDRVWLPSAWVNPGVTIGSDVVVAARSLVNRDLPDGCLAGGIPAQVLRAGCYPQRLTLAQRCGVIEQIVQEAASIAGQRPADFSVGDRSSRIVVTGGEVFELDERRITGPVTAYGRIIKNQLRRHGIRFRYEERDGTWAAWA
jgi:acetyltransferase-like isoleucine patch superfamily enzyme